MTKAAPGTPNSRLAAQCDGRRGAGPTFNRRPQPWSIAHGTASLDVRGVRRLRRGSRYLAAHVRTDDGAVVRRNAHPMTVALGTNAKLPFGRAIQRPARRRPQFQSPASGPVRQPSRAKSAAPRIQPQRPAVAGVSWVTSVMRLRSSTWTTTGRHSSASFASIMA